MGFVDEECKVNENNFFAVKELRERYVTWSKENGHYSLATNKLGMALKRLGFTQKRKNKCW
ncbi:primase-like DNA-binding domain-containing protein [Candidatus Uabimicrobium amorphum]|uniref:primase-like DNA-binding domain-containing protein n=1 Tax=Uabimicrobium amorphum TaxID=2596890 RepID=UPI00125F6327|nr:primase-like DNA-binding domain-containing protein [Candidatus Uabimicrobium amorphum]